MPAHRKPKSSARKDTRAPAARRAKRGAGGRLAAVPAPAQVLLGRWELDLGTMRGIWSDEMFRLLHRDPAHGAPPFVEFLELVHPEDRAVVEQAGKCAADDQEPFHFEYRTDPARGPVRYVSATIHVVRDARGRPVRLAGTALDITDRKQAEMIALRLAAIVDSSDDAIISKTTEGIITSWNPAAEQIFGYSAPEVIGQRLLMLIPPERHNEEAEILARIAAGERVRHFETVRVRKDGQRIDISATISPIKDASGRVVGASKIARDITPLKERERQLTRMTRLYAALSQVNQAIVWSPTREELFKKVCRVLVVHGGFRMAWVGWNDLETHQLVPVAEWGDEAGYLRAVRIFSNDQPEGRGPAGTAFREGRHYVCNDLESSPIMQPWLEQIRRNGYRSSAAIPIRMDGDVGGVLTVYAGEAGFFQDKEVALLEEAAGDLSFALGNFAREVARQQAEQVVRHERDFSEAMLNSLPGVFYLYNRAGRFLRWNTNFERVTGYTGLEIAALHPLDFFAGADKELIAARIEQVFAEGESYAEAGFVAKDGRVTPYCFTGLRAELEGEVCLVGVGIDLTVRRRAEEARRVSEARYRTLFDYAPDGIMIADPKSYYVEANEYVCRMLGYAREELIGLHASDIVAPEELPHIGEALTAIKTKAHYHREWLLRRKDGSTFPAEVIAAALPDGNLLAMVHDVTERRRAEETLRTAEQRLHTLVGRMNTVREEEAKRIARELHDDLGQHLTALNMELADLELKLADCTARQREQFARMRAGVDHTIEVVQKISGELRLGQLDVLGLPAAVEWQVQEFAKRSAIPCRITRLDEIADLADTQNTALFRILQESLTNIARHAGATAVEVSLEAGPAEVLLRVCDNGRGISAAELGDERAIGLLGMRERAQSVGGAVAISGAPGQGTTVLVRIPRQSPAPPAS